MANGPSSACSGIESFPNPCVWVGRREVDYGPESMDLRKIAILALPPIGLVFQPEDGCVHVRFLDHLSLRRLRLPSRELF